MPRFVYFAGASAFLLTVADVAAKLLALAHLSDQTPRVLLPRILSVLLHKNFGALANLPVPVVLIIILSFAILIACVFWTHSLAMEGKWTSVSALLFIVFGATSNLLDRILHGFTTDYLLLFEQSAVNVADGLILGGLIWLLLLSRKSSSPS